MSSYLNSPEKVDALIQMWQTAGDQQLGACYKETQALAEALKSTKDDKKIAFIAKKIMDAMTPEVQEHVITLIARDIALWGVEAQANENNLYFAFEKLQDALHMPERKGIMQRLFTSSVKSSERAGSQQVIESCQTSIQQVRERAWQEKEVRGNPVQFASFLHTLPSSALKSYLEKMPPKQWLTLARGDQKVKNAVIAAINDTHMNISDLGIQNGSQLRAFIDLYGADLTVLNIQECREFSNEDILYASSKMPRLKEIYIKETFLKDSAVDDATLHEIIVTHPLLTTLFLKNCDGLSAAGFQAIAQAKNLTALDLDGCKKISDAALSSIVKNCTQLKVLCLDLSLPMSSPTVELIAQNCPNLESLNLPSSRSISDASLQEIATHCSKLKLLRLECAQLSDATLQKFAESCRDLEVLNISNCPSITDIGVSAIAEHSPKLKRLYVLKNTHITDRTILSLAKHCPKLQELDLTKMPSEDALIELAEKCPLLKILNLDKSRIEQLPSRNEWLAQEGPSAARNALIRKTIVTLINENKVSIHELGISDTLQLQAFLIKYGQDLTYLDLNRCEFLEPFHFHLIAEKAPHLMELHVNSRQFSDVDLSSISSCKELNHLDISDGLITDASLTAFAESHPNLSILQVNNCENISDVAVRTIGKHCSKLQQLGLFGTQASSGAIEELIQKHPQLNIYYSWMWGMFPGWSKE